MNKQELLQNGNRKELIVLRDALKEFAISMRMRDGKVIYTKEQKDAQIKAESESISQYMAHPHTVALGLIAEVESALLKLH